MLISICIPAYNNSVSLRTCLDSIFSQTYRDFEVVLTDDSTTSEVSELVRSYSADPRLRYERNETPLGSPTNWNRSMQLAKGAYIKMMHHDDYFTGPDGLQQFVNSIQQHPSVSFFFCQTRIHFKQKDTYYLHQQTPVQLQRLKQEPAFLFFRNVIGAPSATCFKNDPDLLFDPHYKWLVDVDFYLRYLERHPGFAAIPQSLVTVTDGEEGQITQQVARDRQLVLSENLSLFSRIYSPGLDRPKAWLFFQELFQGFELNSYQQLQAEIKVPDNLLQFLEHTFADLPKKRWIKKIKKRWLTSRYNKRIFQQERF